MKIISVLSLALLILLKVNPSFSEELSFKQQIIDKIDHTLAQSDIALKEFDEQVKRGTLQVAMDPAVLREYAVDEQRKLNNFRALVAKAKDKELPGFLVELFVNHTPQNRYPEIEEYILQIGDATVPTLLKQYDKKNKDVFMRERILYLLGNLKSEKALPTVRAATDDTALRVSFAAISALRNILGDRSSKELQQLLAKSQNTETAEYILSQLNFIKDPQWCSFYLEQSRQRPGLLSKMTLTTLTDAESCSEDVLGHNVDFLVTTVQKDDRQSATSAAILLAKLQHEKYLKKLYPIFPTLLNGQNRIGGVASNYGSTVEAAADETVWSSLPTERENLLNRIEKQLTSAGIKEWLNNNPKDPFTRLYLTNLLAKKNGQKQNDSATYIFKISVENSRNQAICNVDVELSLNIVQTVACAANYINLTLSTIDTEKGRLKLDPILIDLKPNGVGFSAEVPFSGAYVIKLRDVSGETYNWNFKNTISEQANGQ